MIDKKWSRVDTFFHYSIMPAGGKAVLFPAKLDAILRSQSSQDIVGWQTPSEREENGEEIALTVDSFMVRDRSKFQSEVMPKHFESRKIESFQRSLNMWGFRKLKKSSYVWVHPTFSRTMTNTEVMGVLRKGTANRGALEVSKLKEIASFVQSSSSSGGSGGAAAQGPRWDVSADWTALETRVKQAKSSARGSGSARAAGGAFEFFFMYQMTEYSPLI